MGGALQERLRATFGGSVRIHLTSLQDEGVVAAHTALGYRPVCAAADGSLSCMDTIKQVLAHVPMGHRAGGGETLAAEVRSRVARVLGKGSADALPPAVLAEVDAVLAASRPSPSLHSPSVQPEETAGRVQWARDAGVPDFVVRRLAGLDKSYAGQSLLAYVVRNIPDANGGHGPTGLFTAGTRPTVLTVPRARSCETPEHVATCLRAALVLQQRSVLPDDVALVGGLDLVAAVVIGEPPADVEPVQVEAAVRVLCEHLRNGARACSVMMHKHQPCPLCEARPYFLAAMERLVVLTTTHAKCCLPASCQDLLSTNGGRLLQRVSLRQSAATATLSEPPLWGM